ncbi:MAG: D-sedoheptulose 7-phosphate isomerase [Bacteroidota bacterium]|nr:D-sedoheptulose 7-phosphate isomerase [Bacteroidota bacterium]MDP4192505.1 D-sedoheptulose 7-phosphate isomerase [Bacteroidota bacterium]MDP4196947.1 D-sedoheptulose 7-phosphate isomerase [Bacteroidota bacterium]
MTKMIQEELIAHIELIEKLSDSFQEEIKRACDICVGTLILGKKIIFFGNGGSAADAQHLAAELSGRYKKERKGLPGIAITTDTSAITAIGNDYDYDSIFERQVEAIANEGDLLFGISTSGNSLNVVRAFNKGRTLGCRTLGLSGHDGGKMNQACDLNIVVPSNVTARIQEMHILIGHIICQAIDNQF